MQSICVALSINLVFSAEVAALLRLGGSFSGLACLEQEDVSGAGLPPSILTTLTSALARDTVAL